MVIIINHSITMTDHYEPVLINSFHCLMIGMIITTRQRRRCSVKPVLPWLQLYGIIWGKPRKPTNQMTGGPAYNQRTRWNPAEIAPSFLTHSSWRREHSIGYWVLRTPSSKQFGSASQFVAEEYLWNSFLIWSLLDFIFYWSIPFLAYVFFFLGCACGWTL